MDVSLNAKASTPQFFSALLEEYKIRLDTLENGRARTLNTLPVLSLTALLFAWYTFRSDGLQVSAWFIISLVGLAAFFGGLVFLISAASHKGLVRADVNALLRAAKLPDAEASEAMGDIYIDRINDLDRMVERQERHYRTGIWMEYAFVGIAVIALLLRGLMG